MNRPAPQTGELACVIADRAVIADIECECTCIDPGPGGGWWDTRVMLDPRELCDDLVEMNRQALQYAQQRGLITAHHDLPHLVRINPRKARP
jgi:hypothetical protein